LYAYYDQSLPTIAILVPNGDAIEGIASKLANLLKPSAIEVEALKTGAHIGNSSRVRVFPVSAIKGLEFEAVFYVDLDIMARLHPDLIDKYLYVGLSRARSFLGVTYKQKFPKELEEIKHHFMEQEAFK
jgi:DNA helicase IV